MEWSQEKQQVIIDFFNYYSSRGPLEVLTEDEQTIRSIAALMGSVEVFSRYRQELGGCFTSMEELEPLPGNSQELVSALVPLLAQLNVEKLKVLTPKTTWGNQVDAYVNGPSNLKVILEEIKHAKQYIHFTMMLFFNDRSGNLVMDAFLDALARGVIVRVMVDYGITKLGYGKKPEVGDFKFLADKLEAAGGKVLDCFDNCYNKLDWTRKREQLKRQGAEDGILYLQDLVQEGISSDLNIVNHRKFIVIDGVTSIIGSLNIGDQYTYETPLAASEGQQIDGRTLGIPREDEQWHDGCFRIRGEFALPLNRLFQAQWLVLGGDFFDPDDHFHYPPMDRQFGEEQCSLLASFPGNPVNMIKQYFLDLVTYTEDETIIVNPYLIDEDFWKSIQSLDKESASRLTLCNSLEVNDHLTNKAAVRSGMYNPSKNGVAFFDYSQTGRFSHWKITYDKRAHCVLHGSYNLNMRSALHDFEAVVLVKSKPFAEKIKAMISYDLQVSEKITDASAFFKYPFLHPSSYLNDLSRYFT
ncbi:phosphatidylserine/phosphatidylglycerophosphate/cardiolipin synthase family protein [Paenibacillus sp. GP183]|uniref:phospholipase D-like domain-containing protein n=1 Tax=Paenibacillus sp. GP183 TaxID=1882751 RepID=UPI0008967309|nr:phosphatidylserine/phosphatidylglycerophosphate/cardiolipin synthase family protein [Paenibacillus sp. GP183]SEC25387.1 cardiolipin synthase [Paenibacillus sp. GP183]